MNRPLPNQSNAPETPQTPTPARLTRRQRDPIHLSALRYNIAPVPDRQMLRANLLALILAVACFIMVLLVQPSLAFTAVLCLSVGALAMAGVQSVEHLRREQRWMARVRRGYQVADLEAEIAANRAEREAREAQHGRH